MQPTIDLSLDPDQAAETEDLGPLAWVLDELRTSLQTATRSLRRYARDAEEARGNEGAVADASQLRIARQQLHQALGALEMVELAAPAQMLRGMEAAAQKFVDQPELCDAQAAATLERASFALIEYLEARIAGRQVSAVALFPQYQEVQQLAGADRLHPADLWTLRWRWNDPDTGPAPQALPYNAEVKARLDPAVLKIIRSGDRDAARDLSQLCLGLAATQAQLQPRVFWKVAAALFEGLHLGLFGVDVYLKRAASRLLQQYVLLAKGETQVPERLVQDLLFFCAQAVPAEPAAAPCLAAVRRAWGLERYAPVDYSRVQFGLFDPALLALARKRVGAVKDIWSSLSGGDMAKLKGLAEQFGALCDALVKLHPPSTPLAQALTHTVEATVRSGQPPPAELAMEVATSVLYLEAAFEDLDPADSKLAERTARLAERLGRVGAGEPAPALESWMEELYRRISDRQTMGSVVGEMRAALAELERSLDQYFRNPDDTAPLRAVPSQLGQMKGVLSVLGLDQAVRALTRMRESVEQLTLLPPGTDRGQVSRLFDMLAGNLGALGFLFDMLGYQPALARKLFVFNEELDELKPVMGRSDSADGQADAELPSTGEAPVALDLGTAAGPAEQQAAPVTFELNLGDESPAVGAGELAPSTDLAATASASQEQDAQQAEAPPEFAAAPPEPPAAPRDAETDELLGIFIEEAREVVGTGRAAVAALRAEAGNLAEQTVLRRAFHTLKGSSRMVGLQDFGEAGWAMEQLLNAWMAEQKPASRELCDLCQAAFDGFAEWTEDVAAGRDGGWLSGPFRQSADALRTEGRYLALSRPAAAAVPDEVQAPGDVQALEEIQTPIELDLPQPDRVDFQPTQVQDALADFGARPVDEIISLGAEDFSFVQHDSGAPAGNDAFLADTGAPAGPAQFEAPAEEPQTDEQYKLIGPLRIGLPLYNVYLNEADEWSRRLVTETSEWALEWQRAPADSMVALAHSLAGSSATVGFTALAGLARKLEHALLHVQGHETGTEEQGRCVHEAAQEISRLLHQFAAGFLKEPEASMLERLQAVLDSEPPVPIQPEPAPIQVQDSIDPDVFPVFEEEAVELLPQLSASLRQWIAEPDDAATRHLVLRGLHTLKGSARLAGAMRLGEMAHRMESAIELLGTEPPQAAQVQPLLGSFDAMQAEYEQLAQRMTAAVAAAPAAAPVEPGDSAAAPALPEEAAAAPEPSAALLQPGGTALAMPAGIVAPSARPAVKQIRVRSQLLDQLVGVAGEAMGTGARLEVNLGNLRASLEDLTGNLERLRGQLRDVELHAELQMQTRLALTRESAQGFDPLEFDRFTRVQELTRMMAESVNDVATIQRNLQRIIVATEDDLHAQARQTRELQRDLLRTRMVEFDAVTERLHRVVRQAAAETDKQVRLNITGGSIEMDRGLLDRMVPAFEHLLRNCVAHGIEDATHRIDHGKDPTGVVSVSLEQDGNDVRIKIRDDGGGLNLPRIREKAVALGLIGPDQQLGDAEAANLILMPGFSTATEVTELAGRGIGMDVVRAEIQSVGGRIETTSQTGKGTLFKLVLPLTTAVTQVVMLRAGDLSVGVPASMVEVVHRATPEELASARQSGQFMLDGQPMPFFWAGALLQASPSSLETQAQTFPVMVLASASQRLALQVDEVLGHQEVVVKNLGPQLSRLPGLTGVSALPTGATVLIYNPVALAAVYGEQALRFAAEAVPVHGAAQRAAQDAANLAPLVLVVDDSITVRRVTQRLLQREGYRVALANDGVQALERLAEERPVVMLSDIEMPRMDGFELVTQVRQDARWADLPIVMISSRSADKHREHARQLGVEHYLGKPYGEDELLALIRLFAKVQAAA